jgi:hypothetical protein
VGASLLRKRKMASLPESVVATSSSSSSSSVTEPDVHWPLYRQKADTLYEAAHTAFEACLQTRAVEELSPRKGFLWCGAEAAESRERIRLAHERYSRASQYFAPYYLSGPASKWIVTLPLNIVNIDSTTHEIHPEALLFFETHNVAQLRALTVRGSLGRPAMSPESVRRRFTCKYSAFAIKIQRAW